VRRGEAVFEKDAVTGQPGSGTMLKRGATSGLSLWNASGCASSS